MLWFANWAARPACAASRLGRDEQAGGVLVDAVDDTGARDAADARKAVAAMGEQGVDQGTVGAARSRMHHHAGRLVDHDQMIVLEGDLERDGLRRRPRGRGRRHVDREALAGRNLHRGRGNDPAVAVADRALLHQRLDAGARQAVERRRENGVEAPAGRCVIRSHLVPRHRVRFGYCLGFRKLVVHGPVASSLPGRAASS